jgi:hypothetical protein
MLHLASWVVLVQCHSSALRDAIISPHMQVPIVSAIATPFNKGRAARTAGGVACRGYAWCGGGRGVMRVDVSGDGGRTWSQVCFVLNHYSFSNTRLFVVCCFLLFIFFNLPFLWASVSGLLVAG